MIIGVTGWLLSCGHTIRMTVVELEQSEAGTLELPRRPRMCPVCQRARNVTGGIPKRTPLGGLGGDG